MLTRDFIARGKNKNVAWEELKGKKTKIKFDLQKIISDNTELFEWVTDLLGHYIYVCTVL